MQADTEVKSRLLTVHEAAKYLGISSRSVTRLRDEGLLRSVKVRYCVRYDVEDLDKYIDSHKSKDREIVDQFVNEVADEQSSKENPKEA
jgi:excisionase family DNA binding protein